MSFKYLTYERACALKPDMKVQCHALSDYMRTNYRLDIGTICQVMGPYYRNHHDILKDIISVGIQTPSGREFILNDYECGMFHIYKKP